MVKFRKFVVLLLLPLVLACFLSVGVFAQIADTSVLSMSGSDWSLKVDGSLKTALDSETTPYIASKTATEKELFLTLNSLKDCVAGKVEFKVQTSGLSVCKQLPLDQELNKEDYAFVNATHALNEKGEVKVYRPENIVNSFACFDSDGRKVLHISATKLVDAKGSSVWVDSDLVNGILTVYLDAKWLETASFPVVLDPTFGYTSIGGSADNINGNEIRGSNFTLSVDADVTQISVYTQTADVHIKVGIYNTSYNLIASSAEYHSLENDWVNCSVTTTLSPDVYWLVLFAEYAINIPMDTGAGNRLIKSATYGTFPDPLVSPSTYSSQYSIYAVYTESGEPTPTPTPTATPTASPAPSVTPIVNGDLTDTEWFVSALMLVLVVVNIVLIAVPFALVRFVFGALAFSLSALAFTLDQIPLSPYLQIMSMVVSVVCMFLAARARE